VKESTKANKPGKRSDNSSRNLFLNISIVILSVIIIFLSYSLLNKLNAFDSPMQNDDSLMRKEIIQVEVLNGCGIPGIADKITDELRKKKFDVVHTGNYRTFNIDKSIIIDRTGNFANAKYLADVIGVDGGQVIRQKNKDYLLDVTFIIGKDYKKLLRKK
jgi:hypothetical protein